MERDTDFEAWLARTETPDEDARARARAARRAAFDDGRLDAADASSSRA